VSAASGEVNSSPNSTFLPHSSRTACEFGCEWFGVVWCGLVWFGVGFGVGFGVIWCGLVWFGVWVVVVVCVVCGVWSGLASPDIFKKRNPRN